MINQLWPWFEIRYLKSLLRDLTDDFRTLETDYMNLQGAHHTLNDRYQDIKTDEIVGELRRKTLEDKLAAFAKLDADGDGKPGGSKKKVKITK